MPKYAISGIDRDVRSGADGNPDVGRHERRRIIDAVTHHRDPLALRLERFVLLALSETADVGGEL